MKHGRIKFRNIAKELHNNVTSQVRTTISLFNQLIIENEKWCMSPNAGI